MNIILNKRLNKQIKNYLERKYKGDLFNSKSYIYWINKNKNLLKRAVFNKLPIEIKEIIKNKRYRNYIKLSYYKTPYTVEESFSLISNITRSEKGYDVVDTNFIYNDKKLLKRFNKINLKIKEQCSIIDNEIKKLDLILLQSKTIKDILALKPELEKYFIIE